MMLKLVAPKIFKGVVADYGTRITAMNRLLGDSV